MIRANPPEAHDGDAGGFDLTAMLDVIFILLVFFILTANAVDHALEVDLPARGAEQARPVEAPARLDLTLLADDRWRLDARETAAWDEVVAALEAAKADGRAVILAGDRALPMERLLQVLAELSRLRIDNAQVLMDTRSTPDSHPETGGRKS